MMLRLGPYGDAFGAKPDGLTLKRLKAAPHGIDFGPLQPRLPEVLRTPSGKVELAPEQLVADVARLRAALDRRRRRLRPDRPPAPAVEQQLDAQPARAGGRHEPLHAADPPRRRGRTRRHGHARTSRARAANWRRPSRSPTPSGAAWSRCRTAGVTTAAAPKQSVAAGQPGVNVNQLNDGASLDPLSGTAVLNGIPVADRSGAAS